MRRPIAVALLFLALGAAPGYTQTTVESITPTLAELLKNIYGPNGLVVDSESVLPDGSTHSSHFNGAFQSEFEQINLALVRQLGGLPIPSPASGFTYAFDPANGTFVRTTQSFGPILADRAETIGRGRFAFGYSVQQFSFETFDGIRLSHIPGIFTHDDFQLGGGRGDFITTQNAISASVSQSTLSMTFGVMDRLDFSIAAPLIRTSLTVISDATIHRVGTGSNRTIHFFRDPDAPNGYGSERRFVSSGSAGGLGDVIVRLKGTALRRSQAGVAVGIEARLPTGDEENLLGSGSLGVKGFGAASAIIGRIAPHVNVGYQWNGATVLAGDIATRATGKLPAELSYAIGADAGIDKRMSIAFDILGRRSNGAPQLRSARFQVPGTNESFPDIAFGVGSLNIVNGSIGMKVNVARTILATINMQFKLNDAGVRAKVIPLIGLEFGL
jgi:hypothetical protein